MDDSDSRIDRAREALTRRAWAEAYDAFGGIDRSALTGRDLEGLADAAWWISRLDVSLDARHQAYAAYAQEGDELGAGAAAARLAIEHFVREEPSVGAGYLMRARRHAEGIPPERRARVPGDGRIERRPVLGRPRRARSRRHARLSRSARRFGNRDLIAMAIHTEGLALIDAGHVADGLALLDEAMTTVLAGDLDPYFTGIIYCNLIQACLELNDIRRAGEWSDAAQRLVRRAAAGCTLPGDVPHQPSGGRSPPRRLARGRGRSEPRDRGAGQGRARPRRGGLRAGRRDPAAHRRSRRSRGGVRTRPASSGANRSPGSRTSASPKGRSTPRAPAFDWLWPPSTSRRGGRGSWPPRSRRRSRPASSTRRTPRSTTSPR